MHGLLFQPKSPQACDWLLQVQPWWCQETESASAGLDPYPMDYYARDGGIWNSSYSKKPASKRVVA